MAGQTMKLRELPPQQLISAPKNILTEILWRVDPARLRVREENINELVKIHLTSQAEILKHEAAIKQIEATACADMAKHL